MFWDMLEEGECVLLQQLLLSITLSLFSTLLQAHKNADAG